MERNFKNGITKTMAMREMTLSIRNTDVSNNYCKAKGIPLMRYVFCDGVPGAWY